MPVVDVVLLPVEGLAPVVPVVATVPVDAVPVDAVPVDAVPVDAVPVEAALVVVVDWAKENANKRARIANTKVQLFIFSVLGTRRRRVLSSPCE